MQNGFDLAVATDFATALFIGALVGIERERRKQRDPGVTIGLRSFILLAEVGAIAGWLGKSLGQPWILGAALLAATAPVIAGYLVGARKNPQAIGLTTELAAVAVLLLGALTTTGNREVAVGLGVITAALLAYKQPLHGLVAKLGHDDITAGMRFLLATFIVLPLLPHAAVDPWGAIKPWSLWLLVLLISGLSLTGYVATRWLGPHRGIAVTALTGSLVSSTATTLAFVRQSRKAGDAAAMTYAAGILLAWAVMFARVLIAVAIVNRTLVVSLLPAFLAMTAVSLLAALWCMRRRPRGERAAAKEVPLKNPFSLWSAAKFAALFAAVQLLVAIAQQEFHGAGTYVVAVLAGTTDVDAITLTMAQQGVDPATAANAIAIAALSNTLVKCGMAMGMGSRPLRLGVGLGTAAIVLAGALVTWLW